VHIRVATLLLPSTSTSVQHEVTSAGVDLDTPSATHTVCQLPITFQQPSVQKQPSMPKCIWFTSAGKQEATKVHPHPSAPFTNTLDGLSFQYGCHRHIVKYSTEAHPQSAPPPPSSGFSPIFSLLAPVFLLLPAFDHSCHHIPPASLAYHSSTVTHPLSDAAFDEAQLRVWSPTMFL
jgi:hypothetical protein